jgi:hypothetical protein
MDWRTPATWRTPLPLPAYATTGSTDTFTRADYEIDTFARVIMLIFPIACGGGGDEAGGGEDAAARFRVLRSTIARDISPLAIDAFRRGIDVLVQRAVCECRPDLLNTLHVAACLMATIQRDTFAYRCTLDAGIYSLTGDLM